MKNEGTESHMRRPETLFYIELSRKQSLAERHFEHMTEGDTFSMDKKRTLDLEGTHRDAAFFNRGSESQEVVFYSESCHEYVINKA